MKLDDLMGENPEDWVIAVDVGDEYAAVDVSEISIDEPEKYTENDYVRIGKGKITGKRYIELTFDEILERIKGYDHSKVGGTLYIQCVCDGTMAFLYDMLSLLYAAGFTNVQYYVEERVYRGGSMRTKFTVKGDIPEGFEL